jgi:hypothetical protein
MAVFRTTEAHLLEYAEFLVYKIRMVKSGKWFSKGLPETLGTMITILAANPKIAGEFCSVNNRGVFCSTNSGVSWRGLDIPWPKEYLSQHTWTLAVIEE